MGEDLKLQTRKIKAQGLAEPLTSAKLREYAYHKNRRIGYTSAFLGEKQDVSDKRRAYSPHGRGSKAWWACSASNSHPLFLA
jgi:hypothetical protein